MPSTVLLVPVALGLGFVLLGGVFVASGRRLVGASRSFAAHGLVTRAEVLDLRLRRMANHHDPDTGVWVPLVRFALPDGRVVEAETMVGGVPAPARTGQVVDVRYDPEDPTRVNLARGLAQKSTVGWVHAFVGGGLLLAGVVTLALTAAIGWAVLA